MIRGTTNQHLKRPRVLLTQGSQRANAYLTPLAVGGDDEDIWDEEDNEEDEEPRGPTHTRRKRQKTDTRQQSWMDPLSLSPPHVELSSSSASMHPQSLGALKSSSGSISARSVGSTDRSITHSTCSSHGCQPTPPTQGVLCCSHGDPSGYTRTRKKLPDQYGNDGLPFLWAGTKRREKGNYKSPRHEAVVRNMQIYLVATLFTGVKCHKCGPWADMETKTELDWLMRHMWKETSRKLTCKGKVDTGVDDVPSPVEARMIVDKIGENRVRLMHRVRSTVENHYMFGKEGNSIADAVGKLIDRKKWMYDYDKIYPNAKGRCRFLSDVIVKAFVSLFFSSERGALARNETVKWMFDPIRPTTICLVCAMIHTAIKDYKNGTKRVNYFQVGGGISRVYDDIQQAWEDLTPEYRTMIPRVLRGKINTQVGHESEDEEIDREAIRDSSDEETDEHKSNGDATVDFTPSAASISNLEHTTELHANVIQALGDVPAVTPGGGNGSRHGEDAAPESDREEDFPDISQLEPISKDSTRIPSKTLNNNTRAKSPRQPTMSPLTQVGPENNLASEDVVPETYDEGLVKALDGKEFILRFEGAEQKETSKMTYAQFKRKYKVKQDERIWYGSTMFDDAKGYPNFVRQALSERIITLERGKDSDFQSPSR